MLKVDQVHIDELKTAIQLLKKEEPSRFDIEKAMDKLRKSLID